MNFTKEYIEECDCKEIQGLRKELKVGDWYLEIKVGIEIRVVNRLDFEDGDCIIISSFTGYPPYQYRYQRKEVIWLPTGDQLDDEIERICKEKYEWYNWIYHTESGLDSSKTKMRYYAFIVDNQERPICGDTCIIVYNPLIAKILLLKQLLKEQ